MKTYFLERCTGGAKNVNFWKTVKPFFFKKCNSGDQNIILCEDNKIINDTCEVSEKFNTFFSTVADESINGRINKEKRKLKYVKKGTCKLLK